VVARRLWLPGTDHAGIATQIVVERQLQEQGQSRHDLGRKNFPSRCGSGREKSGKTITTQMRRMGDSVDWSREYFTMDEGLSQVVTQTFVQLYEQGLIYRGKRLVNWDPELKTAVSDLEVVSEEEDGFLWYIAYPLVDSDGSLAATGPAALVVATTRPETMLGDVAVMVHPEDERYKHLVGKMCGCPSAIATSRSSPTSTLTRLRYRRGEGHAGPRRQRLRGGPAPPAADHRRVDAGCEDQRKRAGQVSGAGPLRRPQKGGGRSRSAGPAGRDEKAQTDRSRAANAPGRSSSRC